MSKTRTNLDVIFGGCTLTGNKPSNDDAFVAHLPKGKQEQRLKGAVACIADGVSGSDNAKMASQLACENMVTDYYSAPDFWSVKTAASQVIYALNNWFFSQNNKQFGHNGISDSAYLTTLSCLIIKSNTAHIFHVGDSRIYRISQDGIQQLTTDQNYPIDASSTYLRQALGLHEAIELTYQKLPIKPGDRFLLSSDGVHQNLSQKQLYALCSNTVSDLETIAQSLVHDALDKNDSDNASALLIEVKSLPNLEFSEVNDDFLTLTIPPVLKPEQVIDDYTVIKRLAKEARSLVYLVRNNKDNKRYILKAPAKQYAQEQAYMEGFALEHWLAIKLASPYLMKGYPRPENSEYLYHISEYIQGETLRAWMDKKAPVTLTEAQAILKAMIKSVHVLHKNSIVHRDLKPENFIFDHNGTLKLIDFGTVELGSLKDDVTVPTQQEPMGDIGYLAPEYLVKGYGSTRSDLYSLAVIVYELLTAELPYSAILSNQDTPRDYEYWLYRSLFRTPKYSPYLPYWVDNVLKKALSPEPDNRYSTLSEFETQLNLPTEESLRLKHQIPFIQRNPIKFYQGLSLVIFVILLIQTVYFYA